MIKPKRVAMRQQKPYARIHNFDEVHQIVFHGLALGFPFFVALTMST